MIDILFDAPMRPHGKGRPKARVILGAKSFAQMYTPPETAVWEHDFASIAARHCPHNVIDEPVRVDILAVKPRTQGLNKKKYPDGLIWSTTKPDADNIRKSVLDALKAFWRDDALVCAGHTLSAYAERGRGARVVVRIRDLESTSADALAKMLGLIAEPPDRDSADMTQPLPAKRSANNGKDVLSIWIDAPLRNYVRATLRAKAAEKQLAAIATLVSIYDRQDEPDGHVSARRTLQAIGETIGEAGSICRSRHDSEGRHACE